MFYFCRFPTLNNFRLFLTLISTKVYTRYQQLPFLNMLLKFKGDKSKFSQIYVEFGKMFCTVKTTTMSRRVDMYNIVVGWKDFLFLLGFHSLNNIFKTSFFSFIWFHSFLPFKSVTIVLFSFFLYKSFDFSLELHLKISNFTVEFKDSLINSFFPEYFHKKWVKLSKATKFSDKTFIETE